MYVIVSKYARISIIEASNLYFDDFLLLYRNALITQMMGSEEGQENLKTWRRHTITEEKCDTANDVLKMLGGA